MTAPDELVVAPDGPARRRRQVLITVGMVVALLVTAIVSFRWGSADTPEARPTATPTPTPTGPPTPAEIYAALAPSVVTVESMDGGRVTSLGTGVIVNADGVMLTALHVVSGRGTIRVTFADGTRSAATVLGTDRTIDIAAIAASTLPELLVPAVLGNAGGLSVGDSVIAIGNQLGLTSSATAGVVSGLDRPAAGFDGASLVGLIQFDAAVNPGSSGGPLVNARGETVGIVVSLANPTNSRTFIGVGFAVPIGVAVSGPGEPGPDQ